MNYELDPHNLLTTMKWFPSCGEINLDPFPPSSKVTIITRGVFVTDNEGNLIHNNPENTQMICNLLNDLWEHIIIPDIKNRKESGLLIPFPIISFTVLFDRENNNNIVKYNEECRLNVRMTLRPNISIKAGEHIYFNQICDIDKVIPPLLNGHPVAFFMYKWIGKQISIYCDFRPNDPNFCDNDWEEEDIWLADAYLETILAGSFGHLSRIIPQLRTHDIPFTIGPKSENIKKICEIIYNVKNAEEIDKRLARILTIKEVGSVVDNWINLEAFQKRKEILLDAFKCFKNGIYSGVVTILMSQVEGIITEELMNRQRGIERNGNAKKWPTRVDEFEDLVISEGVGRLTLRILSGLVTFLKNSNLYKKFSWTEGNTGINRHASLHGKDFTFNTRANAIRMILLFDALYWIFLALQTSRRKERIET